MKGLLEHAADAGLDTPLHLLYSSRTPEEIVYRRELEQLQRANPRLRVEHTLTRDGGGWTGAKGRVGRDQLAAALQLQPDATVYLSGAPAMVMELQGHLQALGMPPERIKAEAFWGYGPRPGLPAGRPAG